MTARTAWPTVGTGDIWTAANFNLYCRDNDKAYWIFTTAGDMAYASASNTLARLAIGTAGKVLSSSGTAPVWSASTILTGAHADEGTKSSAPNAAYNGSTWQDIAGATLTLSLPVTCSILVIASLTGYPNGFSFTVRAVVNGVADASPTAGRNNALPVATNEDLFYIYLETGVPAGSRIVKLQGNNFNYFTYVRFHAIAIQE